MVKNKISNVGNHKSKEVTSDTILFTSLQTIELFSKPINEFLLTISSSFRSFEYKSKRTHFIHIKSFYLSDVVLLYLIQDLLHSRVLLWFQRNSKSKLHIINQSCRCRPISSSCQLPHKSNP